MTITASIPTASAERLQPVMAGAAHTSGTGVLVGVGGTGVTVELGIGIGVGVATASTLMVTSAVLLPRNASLE